MCDNPEPIGDGICEGSNQELLDCGGAFTDDCSTVFHNFYHQTMFCTEASSGNDVCDFHSCVESCYDSGTHLYFSYNIHTLYIICLFYIFLMILIKRLTTWSCLRLMFIECKEFSYIYATRQCYHYGDCTTRSPTVDEQVCYKKIPQLCDGYSPLGLNTAVELYINPVGGYNGEPLLVTCDFTGVLVETQIIPTHPLPSQQISITGSDSEHSITYALTMEQISTVIHAAKVRIIICFISLVTIMILLVVTQVNITIICSMCQRKKYG